MLATKLGYLKRLNSFSVLIKRRLKVYLDYSSLRVDSFGVQIFEGTSELLLENFYLVSLGNLLEESQLFYYF